MRKEKRRQECNKGRTNNKLIRLDSSVAQKSGKCPIPFMNKSVSHLSRLDVVTSWRCEAVVSEHDEVLINGINGDFKIQSLSQIHRYREVIPCVGIFVVFTVEEVHG